MNRYRIVMTPRASRDLQRVYDFIYSKSPAGAESMQQQILDEIARLKDSPHRNVVQTRAGAASVRSAVADPYVNFFSVIDRDLEVNILRIRHGARKQLRRFQ